MKIRFLAPALAVAALATGCSIAEEGPARGAARTFRVDLDPEVAGLATSFLSFFPDELAVRPGDTVDFKLNKYNGEPHTVTFGKLVDEGIEKVRRLGPRASLAAQEAELAELPDPFPHEATAGAGRKLNQSGAQPCFLASGNPPNDLSGGAAACPQQDQPEFSGAASFYSSGLLARDGAGFKVQVAPDAKPGTYQFMCMVHRAAMTGALTVVEKDRGTLDPEKVEQQGREQRDQAASELTKVVEKAKQGGPDNALAGAGNADGSAQALEFLPKQISVPVGGTVKWNVLGFHTISFNLGEEDAGAFTVKDGVYELNPRLRPVNSPPLPPEYLSFPAKTDKPLEVDGGRFIGVGLKSSGLLASLPPASLSYRVTFSEPGTYSVVCQVHPAMTATVKVG